MPLVHLRDEGWTPVLLWFNPNIHPVDEWRRRLDALREVSTRLSIPLIEEGAEPDPDAWVDALQGNLKEGARCMRCYQPRMERAARMAAEQGFDAFTSSLLYSIYQHHDAIRFSAEQAARQYGSRFLYCDFRPFWYDGIAMSKELGIYRQKWCGCILSKTEAEQQRKEAEARKAAEKKAKAARLAKEAEERRLRKEAYALKMQKKAKKRLERLEISVPGREHQNRDQNEQAADPSDCRKILIP